MTDNRHAYLIVAHNEFEVLQRLITALDDERCDIFVHIDRKVRHLPVLTARRSGLFVLPRRISVTWGSVEQIRVEYLLMEAARAHAHYARYHLISGIHYPLQSQDAMHAFFDAQADVSLLTPLAENPGEAESKLGRYHFFLRRLLSRRKAVNRLYHLLWRACSKPQSLLGIRRDVSWTAGKAANWFSLTDAAVAHIIDRKAEMLRRFRRTFCGDEYFVPAALKDSGLPLQESDRLLYQVFTPYTPKVFTLDDYEALMASGAMFARKFTAAQSLPLIERIATHMTDKNDTTATHQMMAHK